MENWVSWQPLQSISLSPSARSHVDAARRERRGWERGGGPAGGCRLSWGAAGSAGGLQAQPGAARVGGEEGSRRAAALAEAPFTGTLVSQHAEPQRQKASPAWAHATCRKHPLQVWALGCQLRCDSKSKEELIFHEQKHRAISFIFSLFVFFKSCEDFWIYLILQQ